MGATLRAGLLVAAVIGMACEAATAPPPEPVHVRVPLKSKKVSAEERLDALRRAAVWQAPATPIASARLDGPPHQPRALACTFAATDLGGTAPKFDCTLRTGERIRVKYGRSREIPSEAATARLLRALGFGADEVMLVETLRCFGCPLEPFATMKALGLVGAEPLYGRVIDPSDYQDFSWVTVERKHRGRAIETEEVEGWAFFELDLIDEAKGGAPKAHVDALRLLAVFLAHWDNKSENQRLVCLSEQDWPAAGRCARPLALLQDVGAAFGPRKVNLENWEQAAIWADRATCTVTMEGLPHDGATFPPTQISEAGRRHLAALLGELSDAQLAALFRGARFDRLRGVLGWGGTPIAEWVRVFKEKRRLVADGPPCPS